MFFFFPYSTDAPIYHRPIITLFLIAVNVIVFILEIMSFVETGDLEQIHEYALIVGSGLHTVQWLTCNFLHADIWHLIGNMLFLWSFGLIVEGKLGLLKTLVVYLGIGIGYGAVVQILMLGHEVTYCLGASGAIFGLMSMCLIWAPENKLTCFLFILYRATTWEVSVNVFVALFLGLQVLWLCLTGGDLSSQFLHTVGAVIGLVVGIVMLRYDMVDCEYWDIFSVWAGHHRLTDAERRKIEDDKPANKQRKQEEAQKRKNLLLQGMQSAIQNGTPLAALAVARKMSQQFPDWFIPEQDLLTVIKLLLDTGEHNEAMTAMREYLIHYTSRSAMVRLKMTQLFTQQNKPTSALNVLAKVDMKTLDDRQLKIYHQLRDHAVKRKNDDIEAGTYEMVADE